MLFNASGRRQFGQGFKVYTKTGDTGSSALFTGDRLSKDHDVFQSLGSIDELNAHLGLARAQFSNLLAIKAGADAAADAPELDS